MTNPVDGTRSPYGHAFVLLAYARAIEAGLDDRVSFDLRERHNETASLIEERFVESDHGLLRSTLDADWEPLEEYRGQNANMRACEAFLVSYETTGRRSYFDHALDIARRMTVDLADSDGRIWEHYTAAWEPDHAYNRDNPRDRFRPWGFQPGHHAEWAKLLAAASEYSDETWLRDRAIELFDYALTGWDDDGGFYYTVDFDSARWSTTGTVGRSRKLSAPRPPCIE